jgi:nicotinamide phosphoribosyltransferase
MAFKCSSVTVEGEKRDVFKNPVTDPGKVSKKGELMVVSRRPGTFTTERISSANDFYNNELEVVFENGEIKRTQTWAEVRELAKLT